MLSSLYKGYHVGKLVMVITSEVKDIKILAYDRRDKYGGVLGTDNKSSDWNDWNMQKLEYS